MIERIASPRRAAGVLILAVIAMLPGCGAARAPEPVRLRVMTYNIYVGVRDVEATVAAIRAGKADVVFLQETTEEWEGHLRRELGSEYPHVSFRALDTKLQRGIGILSKYPFQDIAWIPSPLGWNCCRVVHLDVGGRKIQVLAVHLKPPFVDRQFRISLLVAIGTRAKHILEIRDAYRHLTEGLPTLVLGDFNEGKLGGAVRWLKEEKGFRDAVTPHDPKTLSWHQDLGFAHPGARIDHILHSPQFVSEAGKVHQVGPSDHFPVTADLKLVR
jgi:endonuclease/exonuclease/phosphatase family metal-dependent hydrolase